MAGAAQLMATIKRLLKSRQMTYKTVAQALELSEASVKRLFASERFTIDRLEQISELLGLTMVELLQESESSRPRLRLLSPEQEARLVADQKLMLVSVCVLNHWTMKDIVAAYRLSESECIKQLLVLDSMGIIQVHANNRIRLLAARDFDWIPNGPIRRSFLKVGLPEFLNSQFDGHDESLDFAYGVLTEAASTQLHAELRKLRSRLAALHEASSSASPQEKRGIAVLLAARSWEPDSFRKLRRSGPLES
ncbi:helix-turn-helix transcriptional regulator (plasmid) [Paraburkholderia sp. D15]|uniref:helix-turn-helix domain-containing protein n=1 Tax=Paraburkholderia sp. D15 TaxID=2880218 RepID=UPI002478AEFE|nr:helix-turn-helix transcriptional regulator [Paraburkholderia sp. D15]WGS55266.1 helix-turn-helix transcriptional regulator [Paraburkholderia sp. D15]